MKTQLRGLKKWLVATVLCAISLTAGATGIATEGDADFTGTTVTVTGLPMVWDGINDISIDSTYVYESMGDFGKPVYKCVVGDVIYYLKWTDYDQKISGDVSAGWVFVAENANGCVAYNIEDTDSVPLNGWIDANYTYEIYPNFEGCYEDNDIIDPYEGQVIEVTGTGIYDNAYTYYGMEEEFPAYSDTLNADTVVTIAYDNTSRWTLKVNGEPVYTNYFWSSENTFVPENNWVDVNAAEGTRGNIMYISEAAGITVDAYWGAYINVANVKDTSGISYNGEYDYDSLINNYPSFSYDNMGLKCVILNDGTSWNLKWVDADNDILTSNTLITSSSKIEDYFIPQNGWSITEDGIPTMSGDPTKFVYAGETITAAGSENGDADGVYSFTKIDEDSYKPVFEMTATTGAFKDLVLVVMYDNYDLYSWVIKTTIDGNDTILYTNPKNPYDGDNAVVPQNAWVPTTEMQSPVTLSGAATADVYTDKEIYVEGDADLEGSYIYAGMINGKPSFNNGVYTLSCIADVWTVSNTDGAVYTSSKKITLVPQNGWTKVSGDGVISMSDYDENTVFSYNDETIEALGSQNGDIDGTYTYIETVNGYPVFTMTATSGLFNGSEIKVQYIDNWPISEWQITTSYNNTDTVLYTCSFSAQINYNSVIPQNSWTPTASGNDYVYFSGALTADVFADKTVIVIDANQGEEYYSYAGMVNDKPTFSLDTKTISFKNGAWTLSDNGTDLYISSKISNSTPKNGWAAVTGDEVIYLNDWDGITTYIYEGEELVVTGSENGDFDGTYTYDRIDDNYNYVFTMTPTTGSLSGIELSLNYGNNWVDAWQITAAGSDSVYAENTNSVSDVLGNNVAPQNFWSNGIEISGAYSKAINGIIVAGIAGSEGVYIYDEYEYYYGVTLDDNSYRLEQVTVNDSTYWEISYTAGGGWGTMANEYPDEYRTVVATNSNISGDLIPQNKWMVNGVIDETITISGDATYTVDEPASVNENTGNLLSVYPNPTSDMLNVSVSKASSLEVYSISGVRVLSTMLVQGNNNISLSELNAGAYLFITNVNGLKTVTRVIKK